MLVPPRPDCIVVNIGDMFDRMTGGRFVSRRHRVRNLAAHDRFAVPFFWDASWDSPIRELPLEHLPPPDVSPTERWAATSFKRLEGRYCDYLGVKVQRVFPHLLSGHRCDAVRAPSERFKIEVK
jgi:isopenicillin N synthase-like dioxygenase